MKKLQFLGVLIFLFTSLVISFAAPQLRLSDGTTTITVTDGDPNDQAPDPGLVYYNGPVGANWNVNITVGTTKPAVGSASEPFIDLDTESLSTKSGDLDIQYTDTGFTAASGTFDAEVGGLTDGKVEFRYFLDSNNTPFGTNYPVADFPNQVDVYASSSNGNFSISAPYSMTVEALIHHNGRGATGFDESFQLTPPQFQPPTIQCAGDRDLGCNPATIPGCDTSSVTPTADCGVSNITCAAAGPDTVTGCIHERDLVYTVTDNCGQTASCTQHIYWTVDTTAPSFTQCPTDQDLGCNPPSVPDCDLSQVAATDDCGKAGITCGSSDSTNGCIHTRTITYTATDKCGNSSTCVQHITWMADTTPPKFTDCPADQDFGCNPSFTPDCYNTPTASATDDCVIPTVSCINSETVSNCVHTRTITYIATDLCGNTATCVRHVIWTVDTTPPSIQCPGSLNLSATDTIPAPNVNSVSASDDCGSAAVSYCGASTNSGCPIVITRTYKATDKCGNTATCSQTITVACPPTCTGVSNAITSNFNGTSISPTNYIWFSANLSATGIPSTGTTIYVKSQTVKIVSNNGTFTYNIPNGKIIFSPSVTCSTTTFDGTQWVTTVPVAGSDEIFFAGLGVSVGVDVKQSNPVTWSGIFTADNNGVAIKWKWSAAVYKTDMSQAQYNNLGVKPTHTSACSYANSDHAGTPENKKTYVTGGARGGGGSDWTGSWSGTGAVTLCP